jgi:hypothetical protein
MATDTDPLTFASQAEWEAWLERHHRSSSGVSAAVRPGGILCVSYPKQTSRARSELNRDVLRDELARRGWQAVAQVAVDDRWSALRFKTAPDS